MRCGICFYVIILILIIFCIYVINFLKLLDKILDKTVEITTAYA